ncbi:MAG: prepilin-type N-terminal cleavage/methylation domain-containing protein [Candidatus Omnitrophica bacterium]|nr:prepilin-type N-terminal cleavage/methylation domain-containing protein [Candidatus Omnitrophota bacterium]
MAKRIYAKKSIRSFTLIEILVSLAIIGIVVALIIPGVQSVRCNAQVVKCISNLRQLGLSCIMYEQDYDALPGSLAEVMPYKKSRYAESSDHSLEHSFAIKSAHAQYLGPYYQDNREILKCPAAPDLDVGYALNSYVRGVPTRDLKGILLMADSDLNDTNKFITTIEDLGFRHCKKRRANLIGANLETKSVTKEEGGINIKFVRGKYGHWVYEIKDEILYGGPPMHPGYPQDYEPNPGEDPPGPNGSGEFGAEVSWSIPTYNGPFQAQYVDTHWNIYGVWHYTQTKTAPWDGPDWGKPEGPMPGPEVPLGGEIPPGDEAQPYYEEPPYEQPGGEEIPPYSEEPPIEL